MVSKTSHAGLLAWVNEVAQLTLPKDIVWCDGSQEEADRLFEEMIEKGQCLKLKKRENSYLFRSHPLDVARRENVTFICSDNADDCGPTNNWFDPQKMREKINTVFKGVYTGRTMYVVPFSMGPLGSEISKIGVQITDSPYVVVSTRIMARMGQPVLDILGKDGYFVPCLHSVGYPLMTHADGTVTPDMVWPCNPDNAFVAHFTNAPFSIVSYGSGYGGNALVCKKSLALRIASVIGRKEGWLAEHMLIIGVEYTSKASGLTTKTYLTGAFPSAAGKTNLAMLQSVIPDVKITTVGDDIAWIRPRDGRLYAINPENGFFGVAPGTSMSSNPNAMLSLQKNAIFTNVALTPDGDVWWEGMTDEKPANLIDWQGKPWTPDCGRPSSHPNSRFTVSLSSCPSIDPAWNDPAGVPISAFIYGGRRMTDIPLVFQSFNFQHGVYVGSTLASETTAAQSDGAVGVLRNDPFAMLPFCGYNMGDYIKHYLTVGARLTYKPMVFHVNWFRKDVHNGKWLWPGYTQNVRVIKWIVQRILGEAKAVEGPLGLIPSYQDLDWTNLKFSKEEFQQLMHIDSTSLKKNTLMNHEALFTLLSDKVPMDVLFERRLLLARL